MIPGAFPIVVAAGGSRLVYNGMVSHAPNVTAATLLNVPLGDESADRNIYIAIGSAGSSPIVSVTLDGNAMTKVAPGPTGAESLSIYSLAYPTGTSGTVVITYSVLTGGGRTAFSYAAYSQPSTTVFATSSGRNASSATVDVSLNTSANGFVIGVSAILTPSASGWTGLTENDFATPIPGSFTYRTASNQNVSAATPRSVTATATGATNNQAVALSMP